MKITRLLGLPIAAVALAITAPRTHATEPTPCAPSAAQPNIVASTLDLLDAATYEIRTTFQASSDRVVRRTLPAVPNVPIAVDVDGGLLPLPDILVELRLESLSQASLHVKRMTTAPRRLPLRVEVRADPPTGGGDELDVAFGYDTRAGAAPGTRGEAPARFTASLGFRIGEKLPGDAGTRSTLEPTITVERAGDRLDLIAAANVSGSAPQRIAATAQLVQPPQRLGLTVTDTCEVDVRTTDVHVDTDGETAVTGDVTVVRDGVRRDVRGVVERLIDTMDVKAMRELTADRDHVDYSASHDVTRADLRVDEFAPGSDSELVRQAVANVTGVPATGFSVDHDGRGPGDPRVEVTAVGAPLGRVEGGVATGRAVELLTDLAPLAGGQDLGGVDPAYADLREDGAAVRVFGLQRALLDLADSEQAGDVRLEVSAESRPLLVRHLKGTRTTIAQALKAPAVVAMRFEKADPLVVEYSGSDEIGRLHATIDDPSGIIQRPGRRAPTSAEITADGIPRCLRVVKPAAGSLIATAASGVDGSATDCGVASALRELTARLSTVTDGVPDGPGTDNALAADADGISLADTHDRFALRARVRGLRVVSLTAPDPDVGPVEELRQETRSELGLLVISAAPELRPLEIHADTQPGSSDRSRIDYVDLSLARLPSLVNLTLKAADRRVATHPSCGVADLARNLCDTGTEVVYRASEAVDPEGDAPALLLDTSGGLREGPFVATSFVEGNPNTRLELPVVPQRVTFCQSTYTFCGAGPDGRVPETQLRVNASQSIPVRLFDCRGRGRDDVFDTGTCDSDELDPKRDQQSVATEIEGIRFLEADIDVPAASADDTGGFIYLNTNPGELGSFDGTDGAVGHLIAGDGKQDVDHDGVRSTGDLYQMARRFETGCPPKTKAMEVQFDDLSADHRLVNFILTGDRCDSAVGTTGFNVTSRSGTIECNGSVFDAAPEVPLIGGLRTEICGFLGG